MASLLAFSAGWMVSSQAQTLDESLLEQQATATQVRKPVSDEPGVWSVWIDVDLGTLEQFDSNTDPHLLSAMQSGPSRLVQGHDHRHTGRHEQLRFHRRLHELAIPICAEASLCRRFSQRMEKPFRWPSRGACMDTHFRELQTRRWRDGGGLLEPSPVCRFGGPVPVL